KAGTTIRVSSDCEVGSAKNACSPIGGAHQLAETGKQFAAHAEMLVFKAFRSWSAGQKGRLVAEIGQCSFFGIKPEQIAVTDPGDRAAIGGFGRHVDRGGHL